MYRDFIEILVICLAASIHKPAPSKTLCCIFVLNKFPSWGNHWYHVVHCMFLYEWLKWGPDTTLALCVCMSDWGSQTRREERQEEFCVSHSKIGLIEWQGGIQQNGLRAGKLQVRQEEQLKTNVPSCASRRMNEMLSEINKESAEKQPFPWIQF